MSVFFFVGGEPKIENSEEHASTFFNKYNEFKNLPLFMF